MTAQRTTNRPGFSPPSTLRVCTVSRVGALAAGVGLSALLIFSSWAVEYSEAPALHERVLSGDLLPVEKRMPNRPLLLQPLESVGRYGGVWRMATLELNDPGFVFRSLGYEPLVRWGPQWRRVIPGVAERWEVNGEATRYTFHLRQGLRWSDGVPFTADDVVFWREHVITHPGSAGDLSPWLAPGGVLPEVRKIDDHQVEFTFQRPNGMFLKWLATPNGSGPVTNSKHALEKCFPALNPEAEATARALGFDSAWRWYVSLVTSPLSSVATERVPTLNAWNLHTVDRDAAGRPRVTAVRNPYYWKIDPAGKQLPYIDEVSIVVPGSADELLEMAEAGRLDMQDRYLGGFDERVRLIAAEKAQRIKVNRRIPSPSNTAAISLNLNHPDPVLREFFGQKEVRIALSLAVDRNRIIQEVFHGEGRPYQVAPRPGSAHYHQRLATQYLDHDPKESKRLLAAAGCTIRESDGALVNADGVGIRFKMQVAGLVTAGAVGVANALARDWGELGIDVSVESMSQQEFYALKRQNRHDVVLWSGDGGLDPLLEPRYYVPVSAESNYAVLWARWYEDPKATEASEPPSAVRHMFDLFEQVTAAPDDEEQARLFSRLLDEMADEFLVIGCSLAEDGIGIVHPGLRNVPEMMFDSWNYPQPAPVNPCQFYFEK